MRNQNIAMRFYQQNYTRMATSNYSALFSCYLAAKIAEQLDSQAHFGGKAETQEGQELTPKHSKARRQVKTNNKFEGCKKKSIRKQNDELMSNGLQGLEMLPSKSLTFEKSPQISVTNDLAEGTLQKSIISQNVFGLSDLVSQLAVKSQINDQPPNITENQVFLTNFSTFSKQETSNSPAFSLSNFLERKNCRSQNVQEQSPIHRKDRQNVSEKPEATAPLYRNSITSDPFALLTTPQNSNQISQNLSLLSKPTPLNQSVSINNNNFSQPISLLDNFFGDNSSRCSIASPIKCSRTQQRKFYVPKSPAINAKDSTKNQSPRNLQYPTKRSIQLKNITNCIPYSIVGPKISASKQEEQNQQKLTYGNDHDNFLMSQKRSTSKSSEMKQTPRLKDKENSYDFSDICF